jgi:hypothetical protein
MVRWYSVSFWNQVVHLSLETYREIKQITYTVFRYHFDKTAKNIFYLFFRSFPDLVPKYTAIISVRKEP